MSRGFLYIMVVMICILMPFKSGGQTIEKYIHQDPFTLSTSSTHLNGHIYFNIASNQIWDLFSYKQYLIKSDLKFNFVDSIDLFNALSIDSRHFLECMRIKKMNGALIIVLNELIPDSLNPGSFYYKGHLALLTEDLVVIDHIQIEDYKYRGIQLSDVISFGSDLLATGWSITASSIVPISCRQSSSSQNLLLTYYSDSIFMGNEIFANIVNINSEFLVSLATSYGSTSDRIAVLDSNLDLVDLKDMYDPNGEPVYFPNPGFFIQRSTQPPVFLSSAVGDYSFGQSQPYMIMGAGIMNNNYSFVRIDTFAFSGKNSTSPNGTINPKPTISAFDYINPDSALMVMPGQEMIYTFGYADRFANDVHMYNYNGVNENLNWHKIYNNGYTQSSFSPVTVLPNNQYLVILNEYNWDKYPYDNLSIHLMILNGNGDLIGTPELTHYRQALKVFPNPCSDQVTIENLEPAREGSYTYELVTIAGTILEKGSINLNGRINFKREFTGPHILRVYKNSKLTQSILISGK